MPKVFATGNLADVSQTVTHHCPEKHTGLLGILLTGTWGATGNVRPKLGGPNSNHWTFILDPATGIKSDVIYTAVGLYIVEAYFSDIRLDLAGGEDGVTDIDYALFLQPRI
jgi:hypothetical protein